MRYRDLARLNKKILTTQEPQRSNLKPIVNLLLPSQKYLIISSDPSFDTNKTRELFERHSGFEERILALYFLGDDDSGKVRKIRSDYESYKKSFFHNFYWTHFSKVYAAGSPSYFWAKKFLLKEIEYFQPECIILFGNKVANFLLGPGVLRGRVNRVLKWREAPVICCLHPSRNWNRQRRGEYHFYKTWNLIRKLCPVDKVTFPL